MAHKRILIADDEQAGRDLIQEYLKDVPDWTLVAACSNGLEALEAINQQEPDIVFLDIQMPGLSGFQVVKKLVHIPRIIFSTAYDSYALKAFDHNAIDYLLKPYTRERFLQAVHKVNQADGPTALQLQRFADKQLGAPDYPAQLLVEHGNKLVNIPVADILFIEARGDYSALHTARQVYLSNLGISVLENKLDPQQFLRIHRSEIINLRHITEVYREGSGPQVVLSNGSIHKVSRSHTEALRKYMV